MKRAGHSEVSELAYRGMSMREFSGQESGSPSKKLKF